MTKKVRILIAIIILSFSFTVNAEVLFELDCNNKSISSGESITCDGYLVYEMVSVNDISLEYETNLNVEFKSIDGFDVTKNDNKISIHAKEALYDEIMNSTKVVDVIVTSNDNNKEKEDLLIKNITINNSNEEIIEDVKETFNISLKEEKQILDDDCFLNSISIDNIPLTDFNKENLEYKNIVVNKEKIFIDAVRSSDKSSAAGLGEVIVNKGESIERDITVTSESGSVKIYKLFITSSLSKEEIKSSNNNLKTIELYNGNNKLDFNYDKDKNIFNVSLDDIDKISIKAELEDSNSFFVKNYGPRDISLKYGNNKVLIKVKAQNDNEKIYTLNITRKDGRSSDNSLFYLFINNHEIKLADEVYKYEIVLPHEATKTEIKTIANDEKAVIKYEDIELADGDNDISITVTSENGKEQEYEINVIREEEKKEEIILEKIEIVGYNIDFSKDKGNYNIKIDNDINELEIKAYPNNVNMEVLNNKELRNGSVITIKINDENGLHEYTINIEKNVFISDIICYTVFGIGLILLIISVIYVKKRSHE